MGYVLILRLSHRLQPAKSTLALKELDTLSLSTTSEIFTFRLTLAAECTWLVSHLHQQEHHQPLLIRLELLTVFLVIPQLTTDLLAIATQRAGITLTTKATQFTYRRRLSITCQVMMEAIALFGVWSTRFKTCWLSVKEDYSSETDASLKTSSRFSHLFAIYFRSFILLFTYLYMIRRILTINISNI